MSINALTSKDTDKGWANLYVNTLTAYNGLTSSGETKLGPAARVDIPFVPENPPESSQMTVTFREVGGNVTATIPPFAETHTGPELYSFGALDDAGYGKVAPKFDTDFPIWVLEDGTRSLGVLRVHASPGTGFTVAKGYDESGDLVLFTADVSSGIATRQSFTWSSA